MWSESFKSVNEHLIQSFVDMWNGERNTIKRVSAGINLVYRFQVGNKKYYLRICNAKNQSSDALSAALAFQYHLQVHNVPVCHLLKSSRGVWFESKDTNGETFLAHVCHEVPGTSIQFDDPSIALFHHWGSALGKMHKVAKAYSSNLKYSHWQDDVAEFDGYLKHENAVLKTGFKRLTQKLSELPLTENVFGLIHGDHRKANVLSFNETVNFIDFDLPRFCWFMDDISRPFFSNILYGKNDWENKLSPYLIGYKSEHDLEDTLLACFSDFLLYKAFTMYLWTKYNWNDPIAPGGGNTKKWLQAMHKMIIDEQWKTKVDELIRTIILGQDK